MVALANGGRFDEAQSAAIGMMAAAEGTRNPYVISYALLADGMARRNHDPLARSIRFVAGRWSHARAEI